MRHATLAKLPNLLVALLFAVTLAACGGGTTQNLASNDGSNSGGGSSGGGSDNTAPVGDMSVALSWLAPDSYTDGSYLNDLQGHHIYMKVGSGNYQRIHTINSPGLLTHLVENLGSATYTFAVTAFNSQGVESGFSETAQITL